MVSNFLCAIDKLNVRVRHDIGIYCLVIHDHGGVQVMLDVQSLENLENLLIYDFWFCL